MIGPWFPECVGQKESNPVRMIPRKEPDRPPLRGSRLHSSVDSHLRISFHFYRRVAAIKFPAVDIVSNSGAPSPFFLASSDKNDQDWSTITIQSSVKIVFNSKWKVNIEFEWDSGWLSNETWHPSNRCNWSTMALIRIKNRHTLTHTLAHTLTHPDTHTHTCITIKEKCYGYLTKKQVASRADGHKRNLNRFISSCHHR